MPHFFLFFNFLVFWIKVLLKQHLLSTGLINIFRFSPPIFMDSCWSLIWTHDHSAENTTIFKWTSQKERFVEKLLTSNLALVFFVAISMVTANSCYGGPCNNYKQTQNKLIQMDHVTELKVNCFPEKRKILGFNWSVKKEQISHQLMAVGFEKQSRIVKQIHILPPRRHFRTAKLELWLAPLMYV